MLDRFERPLKIVCLGLAALLIFQAATVLFRGDPLAGVKIPELPTLPGGTNEAAAKAEIPNSKFQIPEKFQIPNSKTNAQVAKGANSGNASNAISPGTNTAATNALAGAKKTETPNSKLQTPEKLQAPNSKTNAEVAKGTNSGDATNAISPGTKSAASNVVAANKTNVDMKQNEAGKPHPPGDMMAQMMGGGMPGMPGRRGGRNGPGGKPIKLPAEVQARVDRIIESEILGPTARPVPMALVGISDDEAFIRATNGQTGPIKIGGEMAGIKLLRIALNRVLVEQDGEKKELTLFGGIGSESLMPKTPDAGAANSPNTNAPSTNSSGVKPPARIRPARTASTNLPVSSQPKEAP